MSDISTLQAIIDDAERTVAAAQEELASAAAILAHRVGPLAAAHRLAELALEFHELAAQEVPTP
ncbi:hypothetical protein [Shinella pollutisoli]|uniref:Uncharacterized protein n=1 Tax=Shinella pollutisoli TaxID=2250594 RepID=A0ABV7DIA2_9HYPH|nr:hypothetical protein [Shinella pollutisoli]